MHTNGVDTGPARRTPRDDLRADRQMYVVLQVSVSFNVKVLPQRYAESLARLTHHVLPATGRQVSGRLSSVTKTVVELVVGTELP